MNFRFLRVQMIRWWLYLAGMVAVAVAEPTELREWTAEGGAKVNGRVLEIKEGKASLEREDGQKVVIDISVLVESDISYLAGHFGVKLPMPNDPERSSDPTATGLAHPLGEFFGPVVAGSGSYHAYLPTTLKKGRKAPLLFYTNAGGGNRGLLKSLSEGAELCGWVLAVSVESSNKAGIDRNVDFSKDAVEHILKTLPVDDKRLYFTGNSGGGATAMANAASIDGAAGAMPNVGYTPQGYRPPKGHYYVLGGGADFNRYMTAAINKNFGNDAVHRMHPGDHGGTPAWQRIDGMIWLNLRYLESHANTHRAECLDFEARLIDWMREKEKTDAHRAYATGMLLETDYQIQGKNGKLVRALTKKLAEDPKNGLYHQGLELIDEISKDSYADVGSGSKFNHVHQPAAARIKRELPTYSGVPVIEATLKAMAGPTQGRP